MSLSNMSFKYVHAIYPEQLSSVALCVSPHYCNGLLVFANVTDLGSSTMDMGRNEGYQCHAVPIQGQGTSAVFRSKHYQLNVCKSEENSPSVMISVCQL